MMSAADQERMDAVWLSRSLRAGVLLAGGLIVIGLALFIANGADSTTLDDALGRNGELPRVSLDSLRHGVADGDALTFIQLGILALVLTPTLRVATTLVIFARRRDGAFVGLAAVVLVILLLGLVGIGA